MEVRYIWRVTLDGKTVEVCGRDKLEATKQAARQLGVQWSRMARDMEVLRLRRRSGHDLPRAGADAGTPSRP